MLELDGEIGAMQRVLDATTTRANVILHNLANANTPGYKRYEVHFEEALREAYRQGEDGSDVGPEIRRDMSGDPGQNNVDPNEELARLRKVEVMHDLFAQRLGGYFRQMRTAIRGRI